MAAVVACLLASVDVNSLAVGRRSSVDGRSPTSVGMGRRRSMVEVESVGGVRRRSVMLGEVESIGVGRRRSVKVERIASVGKGRRRSMIEVAGPCALPGLPPKGEVVFALCAELPRDPVTRGPAVVGVVEIPTVVFTESLVVMLGSVMSRWRSG